MSWANSLTTTLAYAQCGWWDTTDNATRRPTGVLECPHCAAVCGTMPETLAPNTPRGQCDAGK